MNHVTLNKVITNGARSMFEKYWEYVLNQFWIPLSQYCIKVLYTIYTRVTIFNMVLFLIKYIPTCVVTYGFIKTIFATSRERIKAKQLELDELQLQIQIVKTKLSVRDAEFAEREELLRRKLDNFRRVRARVQDIIADDAELRNAINGNEDDNIFSNSNNSEEVTSENRFIVELLRELMYDQVEIPDLDSEMLSCGEPTHEPAISENSISVADENEKQDCHMDNVKKIMDDWQKNLSLVTNSKKLCLLPQVELASQEAMGDCSKPYNFSDSDSEFINSTDNFHDNYSLSWLQNQYSPGYAYNYDEFYGDTAVLREYYDVREHEQCHEEQHDCNKGVLYIVPEETISQMEIKEIESDAD